INNRKNKTKVVLRISVDASHISRIGDDKILNIIRVFENNFCQDDKFNLQIHTIENDKSVDKIIDKTGSRKILYNKNNEIIKNLNRYVLVTPRNLNIQVESAKLFNSDLKVDVHDSVKNNMAKNVFLKDLIESQDGSFSLYKDQSGELGLDYYINYNGNVSTWGNYQRFNVPNLYIHSPNEIKQSLYSDPVSYSFIDKNFLDILKIVNKVSPEAVNRSILINIRDFSGSYLLEEDKTCLYYGIEVVKEYISRGLIDKINLDKLSLELKKSLNMSEKELIKSYNDSLYDIFSQLQQGTFIKEKWDDVFELINLGHYKVSEMRENMAKEYYRNQTGLDYQFIESKKIDPKQQSRLLEKLCPINSEAENLLKNQYQNNTDDVIDKIRD
ncbi:MAG: hypothetical protein IJS74_03070, partial [Clostridia bacterium]|nr:hypothetical protein [Clostridia bacterium]